MVHPLIPAAVSIKNKPIIEVARVQMLDMGMRYRNALFPVTTDAQGLPCVSDLASPTPADPQWPFHAFLQT